MVEMAHYIVCVIKTMSNEELERITPVKPPKVKSVINPIDQSMTGLKTNRTPCIIPSQLKILILVGTAIIIVAEVKYA